ncbi:MAG: hypothetical protein JF606_10680 [Burkholderiales bacterium]|nr:hypothetical protein [Burkholderiales bacterium]
MTSGTVLPAVTADALVGAAASVRSVWVSSLAPRRVRRAVKESGQKCGRPELTLP